MSAFCTEEIVESFKFLPRYTLDGLLLVCRQWNHLIRRFERQLSLYRLSADFSVTFESTGGSVRPINIPHQRTKRFSQNHPEIQTICLENHYELLSFLDSHIRNSVVDLSALQLVPPGVMCLIKYLIERQIQRNCTIVRIDHLWDNSIVLVRDISLAELLKVSFLSANKSFSLLKPIKEINKAGPFTTLVPFWKVLKTANRIRDSDPKLISYLSADKSFLKPVRDINEVGPFMTLVPSWFIFMNASRLPDRIPDEDSKLRVTWHFDYNFPEQFIEIFKNSRRDDWPQHIVVQSCDRDYITILYCALSNHHDYLGAFKELERQDLLLEYIWPNANGICPDLRNRPIEIVHPNAEDGRRLTIEYRKNRDRYRNYMCSFIFTTV